MELDKFINKFSGYTEPYKFYNGTVEIIYDKNEHKYLLVDGEHLVEQPSVTTIVKETVNKSTILIPWGCKKMGEKMKSMISSFPCHLSEAQFDYFISVSKRAHTEALEEAGNLGTIAHDWIEQWIKKVISGQIPSYAKPLLPMQADERVINACKAAIDWVLAHNVRWINTERKIYSRTHKYAGTMDGLAKTDSCNDPLCCPNPYKDRLSLIDWKTSNDLYLDYLFQIAAYWGAYTEETNEQPEDGWVIRLGKEDAEFDPWHVYDVTEFEMYYYGFLNARRWYESIEHAKEQVKIKNDTLRLARKAEKDRLKMEALKIKCKNADEYKGIRRPSCNKGNPCKTCIDKWNENHPLDKII